MVVLVSPDALASPWLRREIDFALGYARMSGRLIPVVVRPTDDLPWIFNHLQTIGPQTDAGTATGHVVDALRLAA